ncbi:MULTISPECIES: S8 family serine peptidase [unclassified Carboxylicivirga]|uniref:S8 family serine peptidase n=1 Tax=Carboxylicivirga TaxID=1628153 RepID=UPI003D3491FD
MMKSLHFKRGILLGLSLLLLSSMMAQVSVKGMHEGVVRVKFKRSLSATLKTMQTTRSAGVLSTGITTFDAASKQVLAKNMKRVFPYSAKHDAKHRKHGLDLWYEVTFDMSVSPLQAVSAYQASNEVDLVEPIYEKSHIKGQVLPFEGSVLKSTANLPFDDQFLADQWHYNNDGSLEPSVAGADINAFEAWKTQSGQPNVIVSVVDGGIDVEHADLEANMWVNTAELNGVAGEDDDGNGYIDDIHGFNFADVTGTITAHDHGTHVAGTVAAVNNNGIGVAGVAGGTGNNDGARLMSSQVFTSAGGAGGFAQAIVYGADNGAVISQNSWGYKAAGVYEQTVLDAIDYFVAEAGMYEGSPMKGGIVIFAAGNDFVDAEMYPGYYDKTFCVAALGPENKITHYSNHGSWVDISAPGGDLMLSPVAGVLSTTPNNSYGYMQGTSMACPHVSGIAALAVSQHGGSDFTAEELRLYLESSTHDVDQLNPDFAGKLGVGYIDAAMVLKKNEGLTPDAVTDLSLEGIAQDFATLSWTVPADGDDSYPSVFQLYYHTEAITEANLAQAQLLSVNNNEVAGTYMQAEISSLEPLTTYYFAVRSMDRWANKSALSDNVSGQTNAGPDINIPTAPLSFDLNLANNYVTQGSFEIENLDEGLLKWEGIMRHKYHFLDSYSSQINYPKSGASATMLKPNVRKVPAQSLSKKATVKSVELSGFRDDIKYGEGNLYIIGDSDETLTNSSATKFFVDRKEGFNLTDVEMFVRHIPETGPMVIEVYKGEDLPAADLVYAQEVESYSADPYECKVQLNEQLYFPYGETFWIVFHVPTGNTYCLGAIVELEPHFSDYSFMSFDMGANWLPLSSVIDDYYTWSTKAVSNSKYVGEYITLMPQSGNVSANQSQTVQLKVDATQLINGSYTGNVLIKANDSDEKETRLDVNLTVADQKPDLRNVDVIDFGSVFHGLSKTLIIPVTNFGYGNFYGIETVVSDAQFEVIQSDWKINARDYGYVKVKYTPDGTGNDNAVLTLSDDKGNSHAIRLFGVGSKPAKIALSPAQHVLPDMHIGQTAEASFTISNTGEYPLQYKIPAFDEAPLTRQDSLRHKFGYTYESNINGNTVVPFEWDDISSTGTDISEFFKNIHPSHTYKELELGFEFPFYDQLVSRLFITRYGMLTFDKEGPFGNCSPPNFDPRCGPKGAISAMGWPFDINRQGQIHYKKESDRVIIQYTNVFFEEVPTYYSGTFQIVLYSNGDIDFRYLDVENMDFLDTYQALIGVGDPHYKDEFRISGADFLYGYDRYGILQSNETIFKVKHPGASLVESVSKTTGYIAPGESEKIDLIINTANVCEGSLYQNISVLSNDPFSSATPFKVSVNITGGGEAKPAIDREIVDFGTQFVGAQAEQLLTLVNTGTKDVEISSVTLGGSGFSIEDVYPKLLKAKTSAYIPIRMFTDAISSYKDVLTITLADGTVFTVQLSGEVIAAPQIEIDVAAFDEMVEAGSKVVQPITISNPGDNPLELLISGNDWLYLDESVAPLTLPDFTYSYSTSDDMEGAEFNWEDIVKEGTKTSMSWYYGNQELWKAVELPFEIELFNKPTSTLWISWQGLITTVEPRINPPYMLPDMLPSTGEPNSLIAPYFAIHQYERTPEEAEVSGVYHKFFEDRIVVQWNECYDMYGLGQNYSFQAIIYTNGVIKYQYKAADFNTWLHLGVVGLENHDGTEGVMVSGYQTFLKNDFAIVLTPAEKKVIPAKGSTTFNIAMDASYLNDGVYSGDVKLITNVPDQPTAHIPVNLTVSGEPAMAAPQEVVFGEVMAYEALDDWGWLSPKSYYQEFEVLNTGRANLNFSSLTLTDNTELTVEWYINMRGMWMWVNVPPSFSPWDPFELKPGESKKLRICLTPSGDVSTISSELVFVGNLPDGDYKIPIRASVAKAPSAAIEGEVISIIANTPTHKETRSVLLSNAGGQGPLDYSLAIRYRRGGESVAQEKMMQGGSTQVQSLSNTAAPAGTYAPATDGFNATLEYDTRTAPDIFTGYGAGQAFTPGIVFTAPAEGFRLSHVKTWYNPKDILSSDITVYVMAGGNGFEDAQLLTEQSYTHKVSQPVDGGSFVTIELDEPQQFYPYEKFYVVVAYPFMADFPQGTALLDEAVAGRYYFPADNGWLDVVQVPELQNYAWMIKALEKEHSTSAWVKLLSPAAGQVEAGQSISVDMEFNATGVLEIDNEAQLVLESNDPLNPIVKHALNLRINQGPSFTFDPEAVLSVEENAILNFDVMASDYEGDDCTFGLTDANELVSLSVADNVITVTYSPDYASAGTQVISITGIDAHDNASVIEIPVEVINVNRVPMISVAIEDHLLIWESGIVDIDLDTHFADPDGEALVYEVMSADNETLAVFLSGNKLKLEPLMVSKEGIDVTVIASDEQGAVAEQVFNVKIEHRTGLNDHDNKQWSVYPNPASSFVYVEGNVAEANVRVRLMNATGALVKDGEYPWSAAQKQRIDIEDLPNGVYLVEIYFGDRTNVYKLIKK